MHSTINHPPLFTAASQYLARTLIRIMRTRLLMAVFLICCSTSLLAQTTDDSSNDAAAVQSTPQVKPPAPPPATAHITGSVICDDTHRPARGAMVMAISIPKDGQPDRSGIGPSARVATDGTYSIGHLEAGDYTIIALLPGYLSPFDDMPINESTSGNDASARETLAHNGIVSVRENETAHMDVTIKHGGILSGRVTYSDGAPATQTMIYIEDVNAKPPQTSKPQQNSDGDQVRIVGAFTPASAGGFFRSFALHQSEGTNDRGDFRISGLKPGTYRVAAVLPDPNSNREGPDVLLGAMGDSSVLRIYSGDTLHRNAAKTYELRAGDEVSGIDITVPAYIFHRVQGQVTTLDGRPILVGDLTLTDTSDDSFTLHSMPARDGTFSFAEVPPGTYKLTVTGAKIGTVSDEFDGMRLQAAMLQNPQSLADTTTTVLIKDADITDLSIQLQNAAPAAIQPTTTPATSSQ